MSAHEGTDIKLGVVTGIWHRLRRSGIVHDLKPITQQLVRRSEKKYALLDLYFPDINLAVECDEAYHQGNQVNDAAREADVFRAFSECGFSGSREKDVVTLRDEERVDADAVNVDELIVARVDASVSYTEIDKQLDFIVEIIQQRYEAANRPQWDPRPAADIVAERKVISCEDKLLFPTMSEVCRGLGIRKPDGTEYKSLWGGALGVRGLENTILWFPHLSYVAGGWSNVPTEGGEKITESRGLGHSPEEEKTRRAAEKDWVNDANALKNGQSVMRICFAHSMNALGQRGYRFMGVYKLNAVESKAGETAPVSMIWKRCEKKYRF